MVHVGIAGRSNYYFFWAMIIAAGAILGIVLLPQKAGAQAKFSAERIVAHAQELVRGQFSQDVQIEYIGSLQDQTFADSDVSADFSLPERPSGSQYNVIAVFMNEQTGRKLRKISIPFRITEWVEVAVAVRRIEGGSIISQDDLRIEKRQKQTVAASALAPTNVIGKKARRSLAANSILDEGDVLSGASILRGSEVTIMAVAGSIAVKTTGRALSDASEGEEISVMRRGTQNALTGIAGANNTVFLLP